LASSFLFVYADILQAYGTHKLTSWQILLYRAIAQTVLMFFLHAAWSHCSMRRTSFVNGSYTRIDDDEIRVFIYFFLGPSTTRLRNLTQGILGGLLLLGLYASLERIPVGDANAIYFLTPLFCFILAPCTLKEPFKLYRLAVSVMMLGGALLIIRPPVIFGPNTLIRFTPTSTDLHLVNMSSGYMVEPNGHPYAGYLIAFLYPASTALMTIVTRQSVKKAEISPALYNLWQGVGMFIVVGIAYASGITKDPLFHNSMLDYCYLGGILVSGIIGAWFLTKTADYISPSLMNVFRSVDVIATFGLQFYYEPGIIFHPTSLVGIALLCFSAVFIAVEGKLMKKHPNPWCF